MPDQRKVEGAGGQGSGRWQWGGTQTGSGCNFLRKLSETFLVQSVGTSEESRGRKRRDKVKDGESKKKIKKKIEAKLHQRKPLVPLDPVFTRESGKEVTAQHERNLDE